VNGHYAKSDWLAVDAAVLPRLTQRASGFCLGTRNYRSRQESSGALFRRRAHLLQSFVIASPSRHIIPTLANNLARLSQN